MKFSYNSNNSNGVGVTVGGATTVRGEGKSRLHNASHRITWNHMTSLCDIEFAAHPNCPSIVRLAARKLDKK